MSVMLIGLPGSGKSTLGRAAAAQLTRAFVDMDDWIEEKAGMSVKALFEKGEHVFRALERKAVAALARTDAIVACGGGVILCEENRRALRAGGPVIWIDRPVQCILRDIDTASRPLLAGGPDRLKEIAAAREALYRATATVRLDNREDAQAAVAALVQVILRINA